MDWEIVSVIAQVVGAVGVIGSLLFVGIQVKQNTKALRMGTAADVMQWNADITDPMIGDREFAAALAQAVATDGGNPDPGRRLQVHAWLFAALKQAETAYYHYVNGFIDEEMWLSWASWMHLWLKTPRFETYWRERGVGFHDGFREQVERWLAAPAPMRGVGQPSDSLTKVTES